MRCVPTIVKTKEGRKEGRKEGKKEGRKRQGTLLGSYDDHEWANKWSASRRYLSPGISRQHRYVHICQLVIIIIMTSFAPISSTIKSGGLRSPLAYRESNLSI